jgi:hypothetical protein
MIENFYDCGRPAGREPAVPLTLLHPVFGHFVDDAKKIVPTREDYAIAHKLKQQMSDFYPKEGERRHKVCLALREYGIDINPGSIGASEYKTDGHILTADRPILIVELKNEIGWRGAEPFLQALLYYCIFCDEYNLWEDYSSCHPCLIIVLAGQSEPNLLFLRRF